MKVLFCDPLNTQNLFYTYTKYMREKGVDARLLTGPRSVVPREHRPDWNSTTAPVSDDTNYPEWVVKDVEMPYFLPFRHPVSYLTKMKKIADLANTFDIIACAGLAPMWICWSKRPFIFWSFGADIDQMATQGWSGDPNQKFSAKDRIVQRIIREYLVRSIRKAKITAISPHQMGTATRLGLTKPTFLPVLVDTELFKPMDSQLKQQEKLKARDDLGCDLIMFHPPRQSWVDTSSTDCKGNDKVYRAFARFVRNWPRRTKLVVMNKGWDLEKSKSLVEELGIKDNVVWLNPVSKTEMCKMYNTVDIVLDQFVIGMLALVALEPLACETPSISYVPKHPDGFFYPEMPPVVSAKEEDDIYKSMMILANDPSLRERLGKQGKEWIEKYCSPSKATDKFIRMFEQVLAESGRSKND